MPCSPTFVFKFGLLVFTDQSRSLYHISGTSNEIKRIVRCTRASTRKHTRAQWATARCSSALAQCSYKTYERSRFVYFQFIPEFNVINISHSTRKHMSNVPFARQPIWYHHHHHLFLKHPFLPRSFNVN